MGQNELWEHRRAGNKGYTNVNCRLWGGKNENLEHILNCRKSKEVVRKKLILAVEEVIREGGNDLMFWSTILSGPIKPELGKYCRIFEILKIFDRQNCEGYDGVRYCE